MKNVYICTPLAGDLQGNLEKVKRYSEFALGCGAAPVTDFLVLLSQAPSDRAIIAKQLGISEHQLSYITHSNSGEGLLFYGNVTIPFVDRFPKGEIYNLLTTRPEDIANDQRNE